MKNDLKQFFSTTTGKIISVVVVLVVGVSIGLSSQKGDTQSPTVASVQQVQETPQAPSTPVVIIQPAPEITPPVPKAKTTIVASTKVVAPTSQSVAPAVQPIPITPLQSQPVIAPQIISPINLSGSGQQASQQFNLQAGLSVFTLSYSGDSNFSVWLVDQNGNNVALLLLIHFFI